MSRVVGIDISNRVVRAAEVRLSRRGLPTVLRVGSVEFADGVVRRGEVLEPRTMAAALRQLWMRARFQTRRAAIGLAGPKVYVRDAVLPRTPIAYLREQLPYIVQDLIPLPVEDAILDFYPAAAETGDEGETLRGVLVAARTEAADAIASALLRARLQPVAMGITPFAIARALEPVGRSTECVLGIGIGVALTNLVVTDAGVPRFVRTIPIGDVDVVDAIARRLHISQAEASAIRVRYGMLPDHGGDPEAIAAVEANHSASWDLLSSIRDTVAYYASANLGPAIDRVVITSGNGEFPGFLEVLSQLLGVPVSLSTIDGKFKLSRSVAATPDREGYLTAVGVAMGVEA